MSYASIDQLYQYGAPATAFGKLPPSTIQAQLDADASWIDSKLRGRYPDDVPLVAPIDLAIVVANAQLSAYKLIVGIKGAQPSGIDIAALKERSAASEAWLDQVQRQAVHPLITSRSPGGGPSNGRPLPRVSSSPMRGI